MNMKKLVTIALTVALMSLTANADLIDDVDGNMQVIVDLPTGAMTFKNVSDAPLDFNGLSITSTEGLLVTVYVHDWATGNGTGWKSIFDYLLSGQAATHIMPILGAAGATAFTELPITPFEVSEVALPPNIATLQPGASWSVGTPLAPGNTFTPGVDFDVFYGLPGVGDPVRVTNYVGLGTARTPGDEQDNPIDPTSSDPSTNPLIGDTTTHTFTDVTGDGAWFDPPMVSAYLYETDGNSEFAAVMLPTNIPAGSDNSFWVNYGLGGNLVLAGELFLFPDGVTSFIVSGIDPDADAFSPIGFPTFLQFDETQVTFTQTGIPEPATMGLMLFGAIGMIARKRRRS